MLYLYNHKMAGQISRAIKMNNLTMWQPESGKLIPSTAKTSNEISNYAAQLSVRDKKQINSAFSAGHYEMAINYLWLKTITALKNELSTVGVALLGEMLGRPNVDEDDEIDDILTARDAIKLAEELGVISSTDALRLRHTNELISHFSQMDSTASDLEEIDESEAIASLKTCINGVLGRPKVEVAKPFIEFREALEEKTLEEDDPRVEMLRGSPYFFCKLTISVLMNAAKKNVGANLEHTLANINVLIPAIWSQLREAEKWQIGHTYAEAYSDGKTTAVSGLKSALLKIRGFDYVPENLRSDTFVKAAEAIIRAHDGTNNFYNESAPVKNLNKLGSVIPAPALPACITALLCVVLGNSYGVAWSAEPEASNMLGRLSPDRWSYYINNVLPSDTRILGKITDDNPRSNWMKLSKKYNFDALQIKNKTVGLLIKASIKSDDSKVSAYAKKITQEYYGKKS